MTAGLLAITPGSNESAVYRERFGVEQAGGTPYSRIAPGQMEDYSRCLVAEYGIPTALGTGVVSLLYGTSRNAYYGCTMVLGRTADPPPLLGSQWSTAAGRWTCGEWSSPFTSVQVANQESSEAVAAVRELAERIQRLRVAPPPSEVQALVQQVIDELAVREQEDLEAWARNLSKDVSAATD